MAFNYFRAPDAPAPDWGAVVHARLGVQQNQQAAIQALMQMAQENQKLQAAKEQHAASLEQDQRQLDATKEFHAGELKARQAEIDRQYAHDAQSSVDTQRRMDASEARAVMHEDARNQRADATNALREMLQQRREERLQQEFQQRQEQLQQHLQEQLKRNQAFYAAAGAVAHGPTDFEPHEFTALETLPFYSPDGSKVTATLRNMKGVGGEEQTAEDVYNNLAKAKHVVKVVDPGWFDQAVAPFAQDLTPEDQAKLHQMAHVDEYAKDPLQAKDMAARFFANSEFKPYFSGASAEAQKAAGDTAGAKFDRSAAMARYRANLQFANIPVTDKTDPLSKQMIESAKAENALIEKEFGSGGQATTAPAPAPAPTPAPGGNVLSPDEQKLLDGLLGPK